MKNYRKIWLCISALLVIVVIGIVLLVPALRERVFSSGGAGYKPITFDAAESPEVLCGSSHEYIVGPLPQFGRGYIGLPPEVRFDTDYCFAVKAKVVKNYTDLYYRLDADYQTDYRLIQMETLETFCGENIPKNFFYLIPDSVYADMSIYDFLFISMKQLGTENYTIKNKTQQRVEALEFPVFCDKEDYPALGNIIAFTDGIFDETLWQTESWHFGYQFADNYLEKTGESRLVVSRGDSESVVIAKIRKQIEEDKQFWGDEQPDYVVQNLNFSDPEIKEALEYVSSFENGVFCQRYSPFRVIDFTRYINGCETEETVTIDLVDGTVTYSDIRYTEEDMAQMENIAAQLALKAEEYSEELPKPPHTNPAGKELLSLDMKAWYAKVDGKIYGAIRTSWEYADENDFYVRYYDDSYTLYDMSESTAADIPAEELAEIIGERNIITREYGTATGMEVA